MPETRSTRSKPGSKEQPPPPPPESSRRATRSSVPPPPVTTSRRRGKVVIPSGSKDEASSSQQQTGRVTRKGNEAPPQPSCSSSSSAPPTIPPPADDEPPKKVTKGPALKLPKKLNNNDIPKVVTSTATASTSTSSKKKKVPEKPQPQQQSSPYLPPRNLLPSPTDPHATQIEKLKSLRTSHCRPILSEIFNQVQDAPDSETPTLYKRVLRLYNYVTEIHSKDSPQQEPGQEPDESLKHLASRYKNMVTLTLFGYGAILWKSPSNNQFTQRCSEFLSECFMRLGWKEEDNRRGGRSRKKELELIMGEYEDEDNYPACYYFVNLFVRHHCDPNTQIRQHLLSLLLKLVKAAATSKNLKYLEHVFNNANKALMIRVKDKNSTCRAHAMATLSELLVVPGADNALKKELKYYTRYDPSIVVRQLGTSAARNVERLKLRFFFDQAFDRNMGVRFEAFKAMGVEVEEEEEEDVQAPVDDADNGRMEAVEGGGERVVKKTVRLIRDMNQMTGDKLCKLVLWGALYSDSKCSNYVRTELLRKWLTISCKNDLVKFLTNLDPFQHLVAVNKIMDMMFNASGGEVERGFVEGIDTSFITKLKGDVMGKRFRELSVEAVVGWLGLVKASQKVKNLRARVVPSGVEMGEIVECLHECVFLENKDAQQQEGEGVGIALGGARDEDAGPLFCVVIGLEICRFVEWEEGTRRHMRGLIRKMLVDPIMEERIFVVQAINVLEALFTDEGEFDELMGDVFQEVFDARSEKNIERLERSGLLMGASSGGSGGEEPDVDASGAGNGKLDPVSSAPAPPPVVPAVVPLTPYQLTKLRDEICCVASARLKLNLEKEELIKQKLYIEAIPLNKEILRLQDKEAKLKTELSEQEAISKGRGVVPVPGELVLGRKSVGGGAVPGELAVGRGSVGGAAVPGEAVGRRSVGGGVVVASSDEMLVDDVGDEDDERDPPICVTTRDDGGVIATVEEGLTKGMFMINAYMDLRASKISAFARNLYENYASQYLMVDDMTTRICVLQFMARVAMIEKKELMSVTHLFITCLIGGADIEIVHMAFKCIVDLLVLYDWGEFVVKGDEVLPYVKDFTTYLQKHLDNPTLTYENCKPEHIKALFIELLTKKFPPTGKCSPEMSSILFTTKYQGLLKLLVRGRLREPSVVAGILALWINNDYSGTPVLRDLESVVKLYATFEWWGVSEGVSSSVVEEEDGEDVGGGDRDEGDDDEGSAAGVRKTRDEAMRVLGVAVGEAVVMMCQEGGGGSRNVTIKDDDGGNCYGDNIVKFVCYFLGFLDIGDQPLMRTITNTILTPVNEHPTRSYNTILVRCASMIPISSIKSAKLIMLLVDNIFDSLRGHPGTQSVVSTRKELKGLVKKFVRVFGDGVVSFRENNGDDIDGGGEVDDGEDDVAGFSFSSGGGEDDDED